MSLAKADPSSEKIHSFSIPYFYASKGGAKEKGGKQSAVFLGNNFYGMSKSVDLEAFIEASNKCLDYIRRECAGCELIYKPHPEEREEHKVLDLRGFTQVSREENTVAEVYFWKNIATVKYAFSIASTAVWSAYMLGINSYTFIRPVEKTTGKDTSSMKDYFAGLPDSFFINSFEEKLQENRKTLVADPVLEENLRKNLAGTNDVWIVTGDPGMLVIYISYAELVRKLYPDKKVNLIMPLHHRWSVLRENDYKRYFSKIITFPRGMYSLRPKKFRKIVQTMFAVKKMSVAPKDAFLLFANTNIVENAILSYFPQKKIAVQYKEYFEINYGIKESMVHAGATFRVRPATRFFNLFVEPLLGLYRTTYMEYGDGTIINIVRYMKSATELYDDIHLLTK